MKINRLDATKLQLEMAIKPYIQYNDLVSALTLGGAAERVLSDLQPQDGLLGVDAWSIKGYCNLHIKEPHQKNAAKLLRDGYDFLRHADRTPDRVLELDSTTVELYLLLSIPAYSHLSKSHTPIMMAFKFWVMANRPDWIADNDTPAISKFSESVHQYSDRSTPDFFNLLLSIIESKSQSLHQ